MEPNISFQKASLVPLLIVERWYRANGRRWKGKVIVFNGQRIKDTPHFSKCIEPTLDLFTDGRIEYMERTSIVAAVKKWPTALFVAHQYNNEYNYMALEHFWGGFPLVHNCATWGEFGYYYKGNDIEAAARQLGMAHTSHVEKLEAYRAHAQVLAWRHSPYNPENHRRWNELLLI
jgi:hypothetical protein